MLTTRRDDGDRAGKPLFKTVVFDVDSTLADIEGIDWLATLRDPEIARESEELTTRAMAGEMPIEAVYTRRLSRRPHLQPPRRRPAAGHAAGEAAHRAATAAAAPHCHGG